MRKKGLRPAFVCAGVGERDSGDTFESGGDAAPATATFRLSERKKRRRKLHKKRAEVRPRELFFFHFPLNRCWRSSQGLIDRKCSCYYSHLSLKSFYLNFILEKKIKMFLLSNAVQAAL